VLYHVLRAVIWDRWTRASVDVSLAACALARFDHRGALALLEQVDVSSLSDAARAVWLNNRAYALSRLGESPEAALKDISEAIEMRPQVAGFRHTRGLALLALDRLDEAIRELDSVWRRHSLEEDSPLLEAERCFDLGMAWARKGETDYAADYFDRARRAAPQSSWALRAVTELNGTEQRPQPVAALSELI
jgi:tetratricopeptide (TPR) repeat protein